MQQINENRKAVGAELDRKSIQDLDIFTLIEIHFKINKLN